MKAIFFISLFLLACNPAKRIARKIDQAQKITDKVFTQYPGRDSIIYIPGTTYFTHDTITSIVPGNTHTIEIRTTERRVDTVTKYDVKKEMAFYRENERLKAQIDAKDINLDFANHYLKLSVIANAILLILSGVLIVFIFKKV